MEELNVSLQGEPKRRKERVNGFNKEKRKAFLDGLALSCNITRAAAHAGINRATICRTRHKDPVFAEQFRAALSLGYDRIEALMLEHGGAGVPIDIDGDAAAENGMQRPFDLDDAIKILKYHQGSRNGAPNRKQRQPATREETNAALLKALSAAQRRMEKRRDAAG